MGRWLYFYADKKGASTKKVARARAPAIAPAKIRPVMATGSRWNSRAGPESGGARAPALRQQRAVTEARKVFWPAARLPLYMSTILSNRFALFALLRAMLKRRTSFGA